MSLLITRVDFANPREGAALVQLLNTYALDPMGGGEPLADEVRSCLCARLAQVSGAVALLAWQGDEAVGVATAFAGFSTFAAKPLLSVHDLAVLPAYRGQGIGQALLGELELIARERGCCKMTLEVLANNLRAQASYRRFGFAGYALDPAQGEALFWQKWL
ncbi:MAG: GNAT family N-acetyltransferase [Aeromonadaceae bacterium]